MREVCMLSAKAGRETPCWWDCGTYCKRRLARVKTGGGGFNPRDLENLAAWFQNNKGITSANGLVSQWDDQSGLDRHLKQATDTNKPALQADGSILFDGADNYMACDAFTFNQPETIYILAKAISWTANDRWWHSNGAGGGTLFQRTATPQIGVNAGATFGNVSPALDTYAVITTVLNGASSVLQMNKGTPVTGDAGAGNMGGFYLAATNGGAANFGHIQVKEIILYAAAHNAAQREVVINYLMNLGGL